MNDTKNEIEEKNYEEGMLADDLKEADSVGISEGKNGKIKSIITSINKLSKKKKLMILGAIIVVAVVVCIVFIPSKFERVENECVHIAGSIASGKDYFKIETIPDTWDNMDSTVRSLMLPSHQENALEAIKYANEELGFSGSVYSDMMNTTALMGRQTEENSKYKVSWTYHPDDGLTVTYTKK